MTIRDDVAMREFIRNDATDTEDLQLVPAEDIPQALTFFILIRLGLAGLTMSLYLRRIRPSSFGWGTQIGRAHV